MKEGPRNCVLSKTWKSIWSPTILEFEENFFPIDLWDKIVRENDDYWPQYEKSEEKKEEERNSRVQIHKLLDTIDQIIATFNKQKLISMNKFKLKMQLVELDWASRVDGWIQQDVANNVREVSDYQLILNHMSFFHVLKMIRRPI
ncbi:hypothetical protein ACFE04_008448 [Oxalis oulophora]